MSPSLAPAAFLRSSAVSVATFSATSVTLAPTEVPGPGAEGKGWREGTREQGREGSREGGREGGRER